MGTSANIGIITFNDKKMNKNQTEKISQHVEGKSDQSTPKKIKEFPEKKPDENDPVKNDPTRIDKPPLIISKL